MCVCVLFVGLLTWLARRPPSPHTCLLFAGPPRYTRESEAITRLATVLAGLTSAQQRDFVAFATGGPSLPLGGLAALRPPLTVVCKGEPGAKADESLPSVMTCQNYLKLPDYSSVEVMRSRLLLAITEGKMSFHLS